MSWLPDKNALIIFQMLKSCRKLSMTVQSPNVLSQPLPLAFPASVPAGGPWLVRQSYSWMDREGRPVSPPLEYARAVPPTILTPRWVYSSPTKDIGGTRKVDINIEAGQSLGLMIRGGLEYNLGIFITGVDKDSVAERAGLMVSTNSTSDTFRLAVITNSTFAYIFIIVRNIVLT